MIEADEARPQLSVELHDAVHDRQHLHVCLLPDFHLNLKTTSLLGSRAKLQGEALTWFLLADQSRYP